MFLREKLEAFANFKTLCTKLQSEKFGSIMTIIMIKSDHEKEFENSKFKSFYGNMGIYHEFSALKTPQHNGVVEGKKKGHIING